MNKGGFLEYFDSLNLEAGGDNGRETSAYEYISNYKYQKYYVRRII
jgi:hypothetical protein